MAKEDIFSFTEDDFFNFINGGRPVPAQPDHEEVAPVPTPEYDARILARTVILNPNVREDLSRQQHVALDYVRRFGPQQEEPEGVVVDTSMPTYYRLFTEDVPFALTRIKPQFIEFLHYKTPDADRFSTALGVDLSTQLHLGMHRDHETVDKVAEMNRLRALQQFDPRTIYGVDKESGRSFEICKIPREIPDDRPDILTEHPDPEGKYVLVKPSALDIRMFQTYQEHLNSLLGH